MLTSNLTKLSSKKKKKTSQVKRKLSFVILFLTNFHAKKPAPTSILLFLATCSTDLFAWFSEPKHYPTDRGLKKSSHSSQQNFTVFSMIEKVIECITGIDLKKNL